LKKEEDFFSRKISEEYNKNYVEEDLDLQNDEWNEMLKKSNTLYKLI